MTPAFPTHVDPARVKERYVPYAWTSDPVRAHRHRLLLPRGMQPLPLVPSTDPVMWAPLVIFADAPRELIVGVRTMRVDREVTPAAVLLLTLQGLGHRILHQERIDRALEGATVDVLTELEVEGRPFVSRWTTLKWGCDTGSTLLVVEARVPRDRYVARAEDLFVAVGSAELLDRSPFPFSETMRKFNRGTPGDFAFFYPESWIVSDEPVDEHVRIVRLGTELDGLAAASILLLCSSRAIGPDDVVGPYLRSLEAHGIQLRMEARTDAPRFGGLSRTFQQHGVGRAPNVTREGMRVRVFGGACGSAWYAIGCASPLSSVLPMFAEVAERAQDLILATMNTLPV